MLWPPAVCRSVSVTSICWRFRPPRAEYRRLFLAHPAVIHPDRKETEKTGSEIPRRSIEIINAGFNDTKTQDVWVPLADEGHDIGHHGSRITRQEQTIDRS